MSKESATTIRQPSTANLMVDSDDGNLNTQLSSPWNFSIQRNQSLMNGFFTRIATTELTLNWAIPNVSALQGNNTIIMNYPSTSPVQETITLPDGFYTVANALTQLATLINTAYSVSVFRVADLSGQVLFGTTDATQFQISAFTILSNQLGLWNQGSPTPPYQANIVVGQYVAPNLQNIKYLDFVSPELTYYQKVKDGATTLANQVVLARWYMAWDTPPPQDSLGFPILMGYTSFTARRNFTLPKQINWMTGQNIANLTFQVFYSSQQILNNDINSVQNIDRSLEITGQWTSSWYMTLQVSEN